MSSNPVTDTFFFRFFANEIKMLIHINHIKLHSLKCMYFISL